MNAVIPLPPMLRSHIIRDLPRDVACLARRVLRDPRTTPDVLFVLADALDELAAAYALPDRVPHSDHSAADIAGSLTGLATQLRDLAPIFP